MKPGPSDRFEIAAARSQAVHRNKYVLPVALAAAHLDATSVKAPEIRVALGGKLPDNRILEGLERLCAMSAMEELPHPGRPHARVFVKRDSAYWAFAEAFVAEAERVLAVQPKMVRPSARLRVARTRR